MIIEIKLLTIQVARVKANFVNIIYDGDFQMRDKNLKTSKSKEKQ